MRQCPKEGRPLPLTLSLHNLPRSTEISRIPTSSMEERYERGAVHHPGCRVAPNGGNGHRPGVGRLPGDPLCRPVGSPTARASGAAFEAYLASDRKMLREGEAILEAAVNGIVEKEQVDFVLIPGDLTKDGELKSHQKLARYLAKLERHGIEVYVIPGNHDINNPNAVRYLGEKTVPVSSVSPGGFVRLYGRFGYAQARFRDRHSLSYVAEPVRGLWVLALDSCKYAPSETQGTSRTAGRLSPETLAWIGARLEQAARSNKTVIAFMHHGLVEHFEGQSELFPHYLIDDWAVVSRLLAEKGLRVIFTGHFHAQDIVSTVLPAAGRGSMLDLVDIETGSLVTYPSPYRIVSIDSGGVLTVESRRIDEIAYNLGSASSFSQYARDYTKEGLVSTAKKTLMLQYQLPYDKPEEKAFVDMLAEQIAEAFLAHYSGNENLNEHPEAKQVIVSLIQNPEPLASLGRQLLGLWTDLEPDDWNAAISLH